MSLPPLRRPQKPKSRVFDGTRGPRFIINDTFRCSLCLVHPPHLIALASIYLAFALHPPASAAAQILAPAGTGSGSASAASSSISSRTRRRSVDLAATGGAGTGTGTEPSTADTSGPDAPPDPIAFLAALEVDQSLVLEIVQEIVSLYDLWAQLESNGSGSGSGSSAPAANGTHSPAAQQFGVGGGGRAGNGNANGAGGKGATPDDKVIGIVRRMQEARMRELREERSKLAAARKVA